MQGEVIRIVDGNTLHILKEKRDIKIRLYGIDAPEKRQAFGTKSHQALGKMVFRKQVTVMIHAKDRYGRNVGEIFLPDGTNLEMVRKGMAWWYQKYAPDHLDLKQVQEEARAAR